MSPEAIATLTVSVMEVLLWRSSVLAVRSAALVALMISCAWLVSAELTTVEMTAAPPASVSAVLMSLDTVLAVLVRVTAADTSVLTLLLLTVSLLSNRASPVLSCVANAAATSV